MPAEKIFIIQKDKYLSLNLSLNRITFENKSYDIVDTKKLGSRIILYICEAGILEISNSPKKLSKWNGVSIIHREDIALLPDWIPKKTSDNKRIQSKKSKKPKDNKERDKERDEERDKERDEERDEERDKERGEERGKESDKQEHTKNNLKK